MKRIVFLVTATIVFFTLVSLEHPSISDRSLRLITSSIFFICALGFGSYRKNPGILVFALLPFCDFFLLVWEENYAKTAYYSIHILFLLTLLYLTIRGLEKIRLTFFDIIVLGGFFFINTWILLYLAKFFTTPSGNDSLRILFFLNGLLIIVLVLTAFCFNTNRLNSITSYFFLGVMFLVLSELIVYAIYFMNVTAWKFLNNLFYSFSLFFLIRSYYEHIIQVKANLLHIKEEHT